MRQISSRKWVFVVLIVTWSIFIGSAVLVVVIDPYLHYRIPNNRFNYVLNDQRYQNDGFIKHLDYNAIIIGTSMTENFKTSEFDRLFNVNSIKVPFSGGSYRLINDTCRRALKSCLDVKFIIRSLDVSNIVSEKDSPHYSTPEYLYNDEIMDDVNYWLNKKVIFEALYSIVTKSEGTFLDTFSFDEYSNWQQNYTFGKESVLANYVRPEKELEVFRLTEEEKEIIYENISQNVTELACEYSDTRFLLFFTPYSICFWDSLFREGKLEWEIEAQKIAIEEILKCDNIELYSFCNNFEMVCNLNNYKDIAHYSEDVNSQILVWMREGDYRLTWDNYEDYLEEIDEFYTWYDYENIFVNDEHLSRK